VRIVPLILFDRRGCETLRARPGGSLRAADQLATGPHGHVWSSESGTLSAVQCSMTFDVDGAIALGARAGCEATLRSVDPGTSNLGVNTLIQIAYLWRSIQPGADSAQTAVMHRRRQSVTVT
jgi:hypothetical protein